MELSEERAKSDEAELFVYGCCSTQIYLDYRETIDKKLKIMMIHIGKYYEKNADLDKDSIDKMLLEQYCKFWANAEPALKCFYEEIQEILVLPPSAVLSDISPTKAFYAPEIKTLEAEIAQLRERYEIETYFLHELKHRQQIVEDVCLPLKEKLDQVLKTYTSTLKKAEYLDSLNERASAMMEKFMENIDKKIYQKFILCCSESENKEDMINKLLALRSEE